MTFGRAVVSICAVNRDKTKLGMFYWTNLGGSKTAMYLMMIYMPHNKKNNDRRF